MLAGTLEGRLAGSRTKGRRRPATGDRKGVQKLKQEKRKIIAVQAASDLCQAAERLKISVEGSKGPTLAEIKRIERATRETRKVKVR